MPDKQGSSVDRLPTSAERSETLLPPVLPVVEEAPTRIKSQQELAGLPRTPLDPNAFIGARLGHFELLDCIGVGGMGRVFRARDVRLDRMVALKVLSPELANDQEVTRRFEQEAKAAARLDDRHFARVHYFGEDQGLRFIAMEYVEGENLRHRINRLGRLDVGAVVMIAIQMGRGLAHAAASGVVHRDIKPSNIIITPTAAAKLVDMGLARSFIRSSGSVSELTHAGVTLGTFDYISPEQARDPRDADIRSDIYSLGCTLYHAATGRPPFPEGTALQKLLQHQSESVPDPRKVVPDLPAPFVGVLLKMLAKDPRQRYQTPGELLLDLIAVANVLHLPLPEEPGLYLESSKPAGFWERQANWAVPMSVLISAVAIYSLLSNGGESTPTTQAVNKTLELPRDPNNSLASGAPAITRESASTPSSTQGNPSLSSVSPEKPVPHEPPRGSARVISATGSIRQAIDDAKPGDTLELQGSFYAVPRSNAGRSIGLWIDKNLTIRGPSGGFATIAIDDDARRDADPTVEAALLSIRSAQVKLSRLVLQVQCSPEAARGVNTVQLTGGEVEMEECYLKLLGGPPTNPCAMIEANGAENDRPTRFSARACYFGGGQGQDGIRLRGNAGVEVKMSDCAFGQYKRPFVISGRVDARNLLWLHRVSVFVGDGPVFSMGQCGSATSIEILECVFSRLRGVWPQPLLGVKLAEGFVDNRIWWRGERNLYHGFEKIVLQVDDKTAAKTMDELDRFGVDERDFVELPQATWPWAFADPRNVAGSEEVEGNPLVVFRLAPASNSLTRSADHSVIGVRQGPWGAVYSPALLAASVSRKAIPDGASPFKAGEPAIPPVRDPNAKAPIDPLLPLVVDPTIPAASQRGVYQRLRSACDEAPAGAVIELRGNDAVAIRDIKISKELTIRAAKGDKPRLSLAAATVGRPEPARLFQLASGARLKIVGVALDVDFNLAESDAPPGALIDSEENSALELENLWARIGRGKGSAPPLIATSSHVGGMPNQPAELDPASAMARVMLTRCDIRSRGPLIASDLRSRWTLSLTDCFVALELPAVRTAGASMVLTEKQSNHIELQRSTLILREGLVDVAIEGQMPEAPRRLEVLAESSAILGGGTSAPLSRCRGAISAAQQFEAISWDGAGNFISGFAVLFQRSGSDPMSAGPEPSFLGPEPWLRHWSLSETEYLIGSNEALEARAASSFDQRPPSPEQLYRLGFPRDRADLPGVATHLLPEQTPLSQAQR